MSDSQRLAALEQGNRIRLRRAELRAAVRSHLRADGLRQVAGLIKLPPAAIEGAPLVEVIQYASRVELWEVALWCHQAHVAWWRPVGEMDGASRTRIARVLARRAAREAERVPEREAVAA